MSNIFDQDSIKQEQKVNEQNDIVNLDLLNKNMSKEEQNALYKLRADSHFVSCDINKQSGNLKIGSQLYGQFPLYGYLASDIRNIYNVPSVLPTTRKVNIAIIVAFHYPKLQSDFDLFCKLNNLPPYKLTIVTFDLNNTRILPGKSKSNTNSSTTWAKEACLDVQWAYAMNPNADITVFEARSNLINPDFYYAVFYSTRSSIIYNYKKADIVSMSWGSVEFPYQQIYDSAFFTDASACYLASTGDVNVVNWPAVSPRVLACGGTTLRSTTPSFSSRSSEITWFSAGCGLSTLSSKPIYQSNVSNLSSYTKRCIPDVSGVANPSTGVQVVYNGYKYNILGGTSVSAPIIAGMLSIAVQKRLNLGKSAITTVYRTSDPPPSYTNLLQQILYNIYGTDGKNPNYTDIFYDITIGRDGIYTSNEGFDIPTGLGVFDCEKLSNYIANL